MTANIKAKRKNRIVYVQPQARLYTSSMNPLVAGNERGFGMANILDGTDNSSIQKTLAQKVADTASVNLSTQTWTELHEEANNAARAFSKLDQNYDRVLNEVDFDYFDKHTGEFYVTERNAANFLKQNYYAIRDLNMDTCKCNENANDKGIRIEDIQRFQQVSKPDFNARSTAVWEAVGDSILPVALAGGYAAALVFLNKNPGDFMSRFMPIYALGGFMMGGATVYRWSQLNDETLKYENIRNSVGKMTFPSNYVRYDSEK